MSTPTNTPARPTIALSTGDPLGIGPEVTVKALADPRLRARARFLLLGLGPAMHAAAERARIEPYWWRVRRDSSALESATAQDVVLIDYADPHGATQPGSALEGFDDPARAPRAP
ncbi:MAG TPA: hypothetical protein DEB06_01550, partial [Phycisphaerales bacterium]|nr:hypothetical protein [Phycisphaerales bacterium]